LIPLLLEAGAHNVSGPYRFATVGDESNNEGGVNADTETLPGSKACVKRPARGATARQQLESWVNLLGSLILLNAGRSREEKLQQIAKLEAEIGRSTRVSGLERPMDIGSG
jgi:hypothetical protein